MNDQEIERFLFQIGAQGSRLQEIFQQKEFASNIIVVFYHFISKGIDLLKYNDLYYEVIQNGAQALSYLDRFAMLEKVGANIEEHKPLFLTMFKMRCQNLDYINKGFDVLKRFGAEIENDIELYQFVIENPDQEENINQFFSELGKIGATIKDNYKLFYLVLECAENAAYLNQGFQLLSGLGASLAENKALHARMIANADSIEKISKCVEFLKNEKCNFNDNKHIYKLAIKHKNIDAVLAAFEYLKKLYSSEIINNDIIEMVIENSYADKVASCMQLLAATGYALPQHEEIVCEVLNSCNYSLLILDWLKKYEFDISFHEKILSIFLNENKSLANMSFDIKNILTKVDIFISQRINFLRDELLNDVLDMVRAAISEFHSISEGPLNKSNETKRFEEILITICSAPLGAVKMSYDDALGYVLKIGNYPNVYLNQILKYVNFNHVELTRDVITYLCGMMIKLSDGVVASGEKDEREMLKALPRTTWSHLPLIQRIALPVGVQLRLPIAARLALVWYIEYESELYVNINRLLRGVPLITDKESHIWINPALGNENLLVNFLCGVLVNWAAAEIARKVTFLDQGALTLDRLTVYRVEDLSGPSDAFNVIQQRLSNPVVTAAVTSTSVKKDIGGFTVDNPTRTRFEISRNNRCVNLIEGERLIPHGTIFRYIREGHGFFATQVNSPSLVPQGGYNSSLALVEAYRLYLSKPYQDEGASITIDGVVVHRPNHGLAHTHRVMIYIDIVMDYFAHHANDNQFKIFCQNLSYDAREWLRVAAAFRVTGRNSEVSVKENLEKYEEYKKQSEDHLRKFLKKFRQDDSQKVMIERTAHIVRWMGNPNYEISQNGDAPINQHDQLEERVRRNYYHRILSIAHKLDLLRCIPSTQFKDAMRQCLMLSTENDAQQADYLRMIRYAGNLIQAHGDMLSTYLSDNNELEDADQEYVSPFGVVSVNLQRLQEVTNSVTRLRLATAYDFSAQKPLADINSAPVLGKRKSSGC